MSDTIPGEFKKRNLTNLDLDPVAVSAWIRELDRRVTALERVVTELSHPAIPVTGGTALSDDSRKPYGRGELISG